MSWTFLPGHCYCKHRPMPHTDCADVCIHVHLPGSVCVCVCVFVCVMFEIIVWCCMRWYMYKKNCKKEQKSCPCFAFILYRNWKLGPPHFLLFCHLCFGSLVLSQVSLMLPADFWSVVLLSVSLSIFSSLWVLSYQFLLMSWVI